MLADVRLAALRERPTSTRADAEAEGERRALARQRLERFGEERALTGIQARRMRARAAGRTPCAADVGWNLLERGLLIACGARHDRDEMNQRYLKLLSATAPVCVHRAVREGPHVQDNEHPQCGMAKKIATTSYLAVGMMVKLTHNLNTRVHLANNTRGTITHILYPEGGYGGAHGPAPIVLVRFEEYSGPVRSRARPRVARGSTPPARGRSRETAGDGQND